MAVFCDQIYRPLLVFLLVLPAVKSSNPSIALSSSLITEEEAAVISRFRDYLEIDTSHPVPDYTTVTNFLVHQAQSISLDYRVLEFVENKPVILLTWKGSSVALPSVLLNSHTDVCPAESSKWTHAPFSAHLDQHGRIFARGSQDMKSVGMQYLEAARRLKAAGFKPSRSTHFSFLPDEEIGSDDGANRFYGSAEFQELNVGVVLDEGVASKGEDYKVFIGEKAIWWLVIKATGIPSHGSQMVKGTALDNLRESVNRIARFRDSQQEKVTSGLAEVGEVVSIVNVYFKSGTPSPTGFVMNLQPSEAEAGFDIRLPPRTDSEALERLLVEHWAPASQNLTYHFIRKERLQTDLGEPALTKADESNPWWVLLKDAVAEAGGKLGEPKVRSGATDARFARFKGIPAFQFSPMSNTPPLQHSHDEFLAVQEYLKGIKVYEEIIKAYTGTTLHGNNESSGRSKIVSRTSIDSFHHTEL